MAARRRPTGASSTVRDRKDEIEDSRVDLVAIGSGDRTNTLATDVENYFYVLRDKQTSRFRTTDPTSAECTANGSDPRCGQPIVQADLFNITSDILRHRQ
ncbi:MAG: hypothetical protein U5K56_01575 [Halioglobus sp.]|nr:hypothetical protein [Halioglobus sp.]